jgi:hypothetical protein
VGCEESLGKVPVRGVQKILYELGSKNGHRIVNCSILCGFLLNCT